VHLFRIVSVFFLLALAGCATNGPPTLSTSQRAAIAQIDIAVKLAAERDFVKAEGVIQEVIHAKDFRRLPSAEHYRALLTAAKLAYTLKEPKLEYESRVRVVALPEATAEDRVARVSAAYKLEDTGEIIIGLTDLARRNPERLNKSIERFTLYWIAEGKRKLPHGATLPLLEALYKIGWKVQENHVPSVAWSDLALFLLEQKRLTEAIDVSTHVTDEYALISMRADRRFDAVIAAIPAQFDVDAAAKKRLESFQATAGQAPKLLEPKLIVINLLLEQQHYSAALAAADGVLAEIHSKSDPKQWYEDFDEQYVWILDGRSRALRRLGRWDEGLDQLAAASWVLDKSGENVSQVINLGGLYCDLGHPNEALGSLVRVGAKASPYGLMQEANRRLDAAVQLGDTEQTKKWFTFMQDHRADAPLTYQSALLLLDRQDAAADWLIERLKNQDQRAETLLSIQEFATPLRTPRQAELARLKRAMIARPDVQAEIQKVGRVEKYNLEALGQ
jgi:beta-barrel assembly-enhancing protease